MPYHLYATDGCHLCEDAMELLEALSLPVQYIDIADDDELSARYGLRIPVLRRDDGAELDWPFAEAEIRRFIAAG
jgi:hypothetical protein